MEKQLPENLGSPDPKERPTLASWARERLVYPLLDLIDRLRGDELSPERPALSVDTKLIVGSILLVTIALIFMGRSMQNQTRQLKTWTVQHIQVEEQRSTEILKKLNSAPAYTPPPAPAYIPRQAFVNEQRFMRQNQSEREARLRSRGTTFDARKFDSLRKKREFSKYRGKGKERGKLAKKRARLKRGSNDDRPQKMVKQKRKSKRGMSAKLIRFEDE